MLKKCEVTIRASGNAGDLVKALADIPEGAIMSARHEKYYDQRDPGGTWLTFTWHEEM